MTRSGAFTVAVHTRLVRVISDARPGYFRLVGYQANRYEHSSSVRFIARITGSASTLCRHLLAEIGVRANREENPDLFRTCSRTACLRIGD